jgi:hypothetical protein
VRAAAFLIGCAAGWLAVMALCGCSRVRRVDAVCHGGSESRHNVQALVGPGVTFEDGAYVEALAGRRFRVEEPSARGEPSEWQFELNASLPLWGRP